MKRDAVFSECGKYRYKLYREWDDTLPRIMWLMLNPSKADDKVDDPTIRRCIKFSQRWGYGSLWIGNIFAYRSSRPDALKKVHDPYGLENEAHLREMFLSSTLVVLAWGARGGANPLPFFQLPREFLRCLGRTQNGSPKHPLYVRTDTPLQDWT